MRVIRKFCLLIFLLAIFILSLAFSYQNMSLVTVNFYIASLNLPIAIWLFLAVLVGCILGILVSIGWLINAQRIRRQYLRSIKPVK